MYLLAIYISSLEKWLVRFFRSFFFPSLIFHNLSTNPIGSHLDLSTFHYLHYHILVQATIISCLDSTVAS